MKSYDCWEFGVGCTLWADRENGLGGAGPSPNEDTGFHAHPGSHRRTDRRAALVAGRPLGTGRVGDPADHQELVELATRLIIREALEGGLGPGRRGDRFLQQELHALPAHPLPPAGQRSRVDRQAELQVVEPAKVLPVRVLHPACDHQVTACLLELGVI